MRSSLLSWLRRWWLRLILAAIVAALGGRKLVELVRGPLVPVVVVERKDLVQSVVATGRIVTPQRTDIAAQITARVVAVPAREGQAVKAGAALIELDDRELRAAVDQARAAVRQSEARLRQIRDVGLPAARATAAQAEANRTQARAQYERLRDLHAKGFVSAAQLDDAKRNLDVAESQVASARVQVDSNRAGGADEQLAITNLEQSRAALRVAESRLDYAIIRAPASGTLISRRVEPGDTAQPGRSLLTLAPDGDMRIEVLVDEKNLALVSLGQAALASADAFPATRFPAKLTYINPGVDAQRGSVEVKLSVEAPPDYLRQDMTVSVDILVARREKALSVAADSVREAATATPWVLAVRDGRAVRVPVRLGIRSDGRFEIVDGLADGDTLIPSTVINVRAGDRVRPETRNASAI
jgi:HlyD family secretion protein